MNQTSGSLLRALRELKRVDEILQAGLGSELENRICQGLPLISFVPKED